MGDAYRGRIRGNRTLIYCFDFKGVASGVQFNLKLLFCVGQPDISLKQLSVKVDVYDVSIFFAVVPESHSNILLADSDVCQVARSTLSAS